jgi:hypothetical protein
MKFLLIAILVGLVNSSPIPEELIPTPYGPNQISTGIQQGIQQVSDSVQGLITNSLGAVQKLGQDIDQQVQPVVQTASANIQGFLANPLGAAQKIGQDVNQQAKTASDKIKNLNPFRRFGQPLPRLLTFVKI